MGDYEYCIHIDDTLMIEFIDEEPSDTDTDNE